MREQLVTEPQWAERSDWSPLAWRNHVKAAQLTVEVDRRMGRATPAWILELAAEELPGPQRPVKRRRVA